jgi:hypothetical protein
MLPSRALCELAQPRCDDVVLSAAVFAPNAAGRRELSCIRGLSERQLLKSQGAYLAERVLLAVTPLDVVAMALGPLSMHFQWPLVWPRDDVIVVPVASRRTAADAYGPAFFVTGRVAHARLELAPFASDDNTLDVRAQLLTIGQRHIVRH